MAIRIRFARQGGRIGYESPAGRGGRAIRARRSAILAGLALTVLAGCAAQPQGSASQPGPDRSSGVAANRPVAGGPDFSRDDAANFVAAQLAMKLMSDVEPMEGYAGLQIVSYGIELDVVGSPSDAMRAAVARDAQVYRGSPIPVRYRAVRNSERDLQALTEVIAADEPEWAAQGIQISMVGPDIATNTVSLDLSHYTAAYRDALIARYGDRVTVTPHDMAFANG
jgi:hypothetical protein